MLYVTIDCGAEQESWDLKVFERVIRGVSGLEREGFKVERFDQFSEHKTQKRILLITRPPIPGNNAPLDI